MVIKGLDATWEISVQRRHPMFSNILVPLDGSELSEKALDVVKSLASSSETTVHLIEVVSRSPEFEARRGTSGFFQTGEIELEINTARQLVDRRIGRAKEYLEMVAVGLQDAGINVVTAIGEGAADEQIIDYAKENNIDLIVMSTHGHGGLRRLFIGSVTDRVVHSGEKPVLVVPGH